MSGDGISRRYSVASRLTAQVTIELPATLHRDRTTYAEILARESGQPITDPARLIVPMLQRFIASDRGFTKARNSVG